MKKYLFLLFSLSFGLTTSSMEIEKQAPSKIISIETANNQKFEVDTALLEPYSNTIKSFLEDMQDEEKPEITLNLIESEQFEIIIDILKRIASNDPTEINSTIFKKLESLNLTIGLYIQLIHALSFLDMPEFLKNALLVFSKTLYAPENINKLTKAKEFLSLKNEICELQPDLAKLVSGDIFGIQLNAPKTWNDILNRHREKKHKTSINNISELPKINPSNINQIAINFLPQENQSAMHLFDVPSKQLTEIQPQLYPSTDYISWSLDGTMFAAGTKDGIIHTYETHPIRMKTGYGLGPKSNSLTKDTVEAVLWGPDKKITAILKDIEYPNRYTIKIRKFDDIDGNNEIEVKAENLSILEWKPDGTKIALKSDDNYLLLIDINSYETFTFDANDTIQTIKWSPNGNFILIGCENSFIIFDSQTNKHKTIEKEGYALAWHFDNDHFATGHGDEILIWKRSLLTQPVPNNEPIKILKQSDAKSKVSIGNILTWSPDGTKIAACLEKGSIIVWDVQTETILDTFSNSSDWDDYVSGDIVWNSDSTDLTITIKQDRSTSANITSSKIADTKFMSHFRNITLLQALFIAWIHLNKITSKDQIPAHLLQTFDELPQLIKNSLSAELEAEQFADMVLDLELNDLQGMTEEDTPDPKKRRIQ